MSEPKIEKKFEDVIQILETAAERFKILHNEAKAALGRTDNNTYREKLFGKARLLIELPLNLPSEVEAIEEKVWKGVLEWINYFAERAKQALQSGETFALAALLMHPGKMDVENNDLEELIRVLKSLQK